MGSLSVQGAVKRFGAVQVLNSIDLEVADGEFVVLVGPSGCGKSTLLQADRGPRGDVGGKDLHQLAGGERPPPEGAQHRHGVPELRALPAHAGGRQHGVLAEAGTAAEDRRSINWSAGRRASSTCSAILKRLPRELSGGQRQRVAMGRAIVRDPEVFLFDEPLSNLDAQLRVAMRAEIRALHQRLGTTTVYVTHDQIEAMTMADRIVVMRDGNVEQIGTPLDLYDGPANTFVATFIGSPAMNLLNGTIGGTGEAPGVRHRRRRQPGRSPPGSRSRPGTEVLYGIRPEALRLDP